MFYDFEARGSSLEQIGWYDSNPPDNDPLQPTGFRARYEYTKESKICTIRTQIFSPMFCQPR